MKIKFVGSRLMESVEFELSSSDLSSERSLAASRNGYSTSMRAGEPSLSARNVGVDSSGRQPKRSRRWSHLARY